MIDDPALPGPREKVTKLVLCSGKVYYDIVGHDERGAADDIAVARVELLYPFPENELVELMKSYPSLEQVVWVQEEPRNMGARAFMRRRMASKILPVGVAYDYVGRQLRAAPAKAIGPQEGTVPDRARGARPGEGPPRAGRQRATARALVPQVAAAFSRLTTSRSCRSKSASSRPSSRPRLSPRARSGGSPSAGG